MDIITYALAKKYIQASLAGAGALKGEDGASAYEIAVKNGYSGSDQQWIESLVGKSGDTPYIGGNGNWFVGAVDTGVAATPSMSYNDYRVFLLVGIHRLLPDDEVLLYSQKSLPNNNDVAFLIVSAPLEEHHFFVFLRNNQALLAYVEQRILLVDIQQPTLLLGAPSSKNLDNLHYTS